MSSFLYISGDVVNGALKACDDGHVIYGLSSVYDKRAFPKSSTLWGLDSQRRERWQISGVQWTGPNASAVSYLRREMDLDEFLTPGAAYGSFTAGGMKLFWATYGDDTMSLFSVKIGERIAHSSWDYSPDLEKPRLLLEVANGFTSILPAIVTTFMILEKQRQLRLLTPAKKKRAFITL